MEKKILIGCIISIAVLIGISFTTVVGYQSTSKTIAEISPLFTVRGKRAINEDMEVSTSNYLGKDRMSIISVPRLESRNSALNSAMERISQMDGREFQRFINSMIYLLSKTNANEFEEINTLEIISILKTYNENPGRFQEELNYKNTLLKYYNRTLNFDCTLDRWVPGCFIMWGIRTVLINLFLLFLIIYYFVSAYIETCMLYDTCFMCIDFNGL